MLKKTELTIDPKQFNKLLDKDYNDIIRDYSDLFTPEVKSMTKYLGKPEL